MVLGIIIYICIVHVQISFGQSHACSLYSPPEKGYFQDGDIIIGGFFPMHTSWKEQKHSFTEEVQPLSCNSYSTVSYSWMHSMIYATKEINAIGSLLPNISLGYQIFDTCAHFSEALWGTFWTLSGQVHPILNYQCNQKVPLAVIGDGLSLSALTMATVLGTYLYPQVSYGASLASLNNRLLYPSFFRTIPGDNRQAKALAALVVHMGWNWVGLLSLNEDYGIVGSQVLKEELHKLGVCLAYHETFGQTTSLMKMNYIVQLVIESSAMVVIIFSREPFTYSLLVILLERDNNKRIWLGTEGWSNSPFLASKKFSKIMFGTLALSLQEMGIPGLKEYQLALRPLTLLPQDIFIEDFWEKVHECRWSNESSAAENGTVWCTGEETLTRFLRWLKASSAGGGHEVGVAFFLVKATMGATMVEK